VLAGEVGGEHDGVRAYLAIAVAALVVSACGVPSSTTEQAEHVAAIAAEGRLLAHGAAGGDTFTAFTRVHARALRAQLDALRAKITDGELAAVARRIDRALDELAVSPANRTRGAISERALASAKADAERLAR
jgi:hypothetical protein